MHESQTVVPRNYFSDLSEATNGSHLDVGMVEKRGWLPIDAHLNHKYGLSVDGNTASTRLQMVLASDQVRAEPNFQRFSITLLRGYSGMWVRWLAPPVHEPADGAGVGPGESGGKTPTNTLSNSSLTTQTCLCDDGCPM